jgi:aminomethyltransferase
LENLKKTSLHEEHVKLGAKMIEFAGWDMPVTYTSLKEEHHAVRKDSGMFDVSHMGEVLVTGSGSIDFVQNLVTNNVKNLVDNQILYAMMCYPDGGVVDDLLVYRYNDEKFLLVINASNVEKDFAWMVEQSNGFDVQLENISDTISEIALQGPKAQEVLQNLVGIDLNEIKFFFFNSEVEILGYKCLVSRTGYTGEDGFEIYTEHDAAPIIWDKLLELGVIPCGLGSRDTLRFEAALPLYGQEIDKDVSPLQAGLGFFVKLDDDDFIGKQALLDEKKAGLEFKTVGFRLEGKGIPRHGYDVLKDGEVIGIVTTGYISPTLEEPIGLARVKSEFALVGETLDIQIRKKTVPAVVRNKRFLNKNYKK